MPRHFKANNSFSLRGNVEGCYGRLCLCPDCLLPAVGCFSYGINLAMHVLGKFVKVLVVLGTIEHIRLRSGTL